ncbi:hypothetical protein WALSEDRAFT_64596 [Wallemia mellicola CBS 633.66]|uniref:Amino acid transporter transmembrane domain-containing protein n=1 Tax=Wallemia mellicola (strain ATCC MYA-4683 / CBS 633.66) TaxID=671144 RepID=I4YBJ0_WALMC|nr:hypothetical protein WALSEDRAFT_64596 [Wallemia mellicola CBS 633.66]EIM21332.1 hypothetical protein WALSEDRAFT_64596 [Wallemia mellicola CBS 633.66]|eukprot:XP_006958680.1 hypothetical protein WALSEDRAFT_64596 [Wallemia mellicola CBS 633.66]
MSDNLEKNSLETDLEKRGADKTDVNAGDVSAVEIDAFEQNKESSDYQEFRTLGWWQVTALLLAETLALGVLSFPKLASEIGVGPTIIATIGLAFLAWVTGYILVDFKVNHPSVMSFADAGQVIGGPIFKWVLLVGILVNSVFIAASHVNSGGTALSEMSSNARCSVLLGFCMALLGFVFTIPRKYEHTAYASFASCVSIFTACLITIIACGVTRDSWGDSNGEVTWKAFNNPGLAGVINSFTEIVFAYGGHAFIFSATAEMKNPNDFKKSLAVVQIISTAFYITIGVGVYILVGDANVVSPALSIPSHKIETIAYAIAMISIIVAGVIPALNGLKQLWLELFRGKPMLTSNSWKANALWIFMAFITWMLGFLLSQLIPFFSSLLSIISSLTTVWFTYGLSGVIWLADNKKYSYRSPSGWFGNTKKSSMALLSIFIVLMATVITPLGIYSAVESIKEGYREGSYRHPFACRAN